MMVKLTFFEESDYESSDNDDELNIAMLNFLNYSFNFDVAHSKTQL